MASVLYITEWFPKPSETFIFSEVQALCEQGVEVKVATLFGRWRTDQSPQMSGCAQVERLRWWDLPAIAWCGWTAFGGLGWAPWKGLPRRWGGLRRSAENLWSMACAPYLARRLRSSPVDHIHAPWAGAAATAALLVSRLCGTPFSMAGRAADIHPPDRGLLVKMAEARFVRVNNEANREYLCRLAPSCSPRVKLVYNCLTFSGAQPGPRARSATLRLLAIGRLVEKKGYDDLVEACSLLHRRGLSLHLTIAGKGPMRGRLRRLIAERGLQSQVTLSGWVPHHLLPELFARSDLLVVPSRVAADQNRDGIPNVVLEALAHGLPVVATPVGGITEVVLDRRTGMLASPGNPGHLAEQISSLADNPDLAATTALEGRRRVLRQFDRADNAARLKELFFDLTRA